MFNTSYCLRSALRIRDSSATRIFFQKVLEADATPDPENTQEVLTSSLILSLPLPIDYPFNDVFGVKISFFPRLKGIRDEVNTCKMLLSGPDDASSYWKESPYS